MQLSLTLLLRYRSRYVFRVGSCMPPSFPRDIRRTVLGIPRISHPTYPYGAITLSRAPFQETSGSSGRECRGPPHHISLPSRGGIRFALDPLRSPLLRASPLISLPPPTRMLHFGGFPLLTERPRRDRKSHSAIAGSRVPCAYPALFAAWHDLRRRPSQAIPQTACSATGLLA